MPVLKRRRTADGSAQTSTPGTVSAHTPISALPQWLRVSELATLWRVSPTAIYSMIARGEVHVHHMGRMVRIPREQALRRKEVRTKP
jgi:excisionase family DNA binding protein